MNNRIRKQITLCGVSAILAWSFSASAQSVLHDFKDDMKQEKSSRISGDVFKNRERYRTSAPSLELDGRNPKNPERRGEEDIRTLGFSLASFMKPMTGKALRFEFYARRPEGNLDLSEARVRFWGKGWKLLGSSPIRAQGVHGPDNWVRYYADFQLPPEENVSIVDVHIVLRPRGQPLKYLLDDFRLLDMTAAKSEEKDRVSVPPFGLDTGENSVPLALVKDGKILFKIVTDEHPSEVVKAAVEELSEHMAVCVGTRPEVITDKIPYTGPAIHVGKTALTEKLLLAPNFLGAQTYFAARNGNTVILSGGDGLNPQNPFQNLFSPCGTLYAAYEFLERVLNVRWYWPGELGRVVSKTGNVILRTFCVSGSPSFEFRGGFYARPKEFPLLESMKWARRVRMGFSSNATPIGMHSSGDWPKKYGQSHPEYFALQPSGRRANVPGEGHLPGHLCMSNPETVKVMADEKIASLRGQSFYAPVMPQDSNPRFYCCCPECQRKLRPERGPQGIASDAVWNFVNRVAERVGTERPEGFISCCSYGDYADPPSFPIQRNIAVTLCGPSAFSGKEKQKDFVMKQLDPWQAKGVPLFCWTYWDVPRRFKGTHGAPMIFPHAIREFLLLTLGKTKGHVIEFCEIESDGTPGNNWADWHFDILCAYINYRLLYDISADVDQILDEYFTVFHGPSAGPHIRKFYDLMEKRLVESSRYSHLIPAGEWDWNICWNKVYPPWFVDKTMALLEEAVRSAGSEEPYAARAKAVLKGFEPFRTASRQFGNRANMSTRKNTEIVLRDSGTIPKIDGILSLEEWRDAVVSPAFVDSFNTHFASAETTIHLKKAGDTLFIGIEARIPKGKTPLLPEAGKPRHDLLLWLYESVELFLASPETSERYQFILAPDGHLSDLHHQTEGGKDFREALVWNARKIVFASSSVRNNQWSAELAIFLPELTYNSPKTKSVFNFNAVRNCVTKEKGTELSGWFPTSGSFHNTAEYGRIIFR